MKDIYKMKLHEYTNSDKTTKITRVPGGWIYESILIGFGMTSVFVPWHDSGRQIENTGNYEELKAKLQKADDILFRLDSNILHTDAGQKVIRNIINEYYGDK